MENNDNHIIYLTSSQTDQKWGLTICTAGYQKIAPHTSYPIKDQHPDAYSFSPERGRILNRRACIPRIEAQQTCCRKSRAEAEQAVHKPPTRDFVSSRTLFGNTKPQKL